MTTSALYFGQVMHRRLRPTRHRLRYRVFSLLVDLDRLPELHRRLRLFSYNRFNLFSLFDRDHGPGESRPLRPWIESHLSAAGLAADGGPILLLCYPRVMGYVFNPLSTFFCYRRDGRLSAMVYEVNNTFGERHSYVIPAGDGVPHAQRCEKQFYVSPFNAPNGTYRFHVVPPGADVSIVIRHADASGPLLDAWFHGRRVDLTDRGLAAAWVRYPLMTLKVMAGIHFEAFRLWRKGLRPVPRPRPPLEPVTIGDASLPLGHRG